MVNLGTYFEYALNWLTDIFGMIANIFGTFPLLLPLLLVLFAISTLTYKLLSPIIGGNLPPSASDRARAKEADRIRQEKNEMHKDAYNRFKKAQATKKG